MVEHDGFAPLQPVRLDCVFHDGAGHSRHRFFRLPYDGNFAAWRVRPSGPDRWAATSVRHIWNTPDLHRMFLACSVCAISGASQGFGQAFPAGPPEGVRNEEKGGEHELGMVPALSPPIIIVNAHFFASNEKYFVHTICCVGFYRRPLLSVCFLLPHSLLLPSAPPINTAA